MSYSKSAASSMEKISKECRDLQRQGANKLRDIAKMLRKEQRDMNIAKVSFSSAGVVAAGMTIAGAVLAPFTAGASVGLCVAGTGVGLAAGVGDLSTCVTEMTIIGNKIDEVQKILDNLATATEALLDDLKPQLEAFGIPWKDIAVLLKKGGTQLWAGYNLYTSIKSALDVARATTHAQKIAISLGGGEKVARAVATGMSGASSNPRIAGGLAGMRALNSTAKVTKVAGPIGSAIGIGFSIKDIVDNSIQIHGNVSEVADVIEKIADALLE